MNNYQIEQSHIAIIQWTVTIGFRRFLIQNSEFHNLYRKKATCVEFKCKLEAKATKSHYGSVSTFCFFFIEALIYADAFQLVEVSELIF